MSIQAIFNFLRAAAPVSLAVLCAIAGQTAAAQTAAAGDAASPALSASDPATKVPPVSYRSVFKETSLGVEKDSADWRKANDEVGKFTRGHIDILKWEEQESAKAMKDNMQKSLEKSMAKPMEKPMVEPNTMQKPAMPAKPDAAKPIAAPAHKH
jgi:hypothetical protein